MANYNIEEVEGIGPTIGAKLRNAGVSTTDGLLERSKTPTQRKNLAEQAGLSEKEVLRFANMVDLFRINGVGSEYAELLERSGVDTVPELAQRNPEHLVVKMEEVNQEKSMVRRVPGNTEVADWITQAKDLPRMLEY